MVNNPLKPQKCESGVDFAPLDTQRRASVNGPALAATRF
jgi:hypothetical protein